ncbi:MAG: LbtU family siderophore porin [Candidatus Thiodiazotropha sp. (ex Codakia rugifera)]|nr:LbtU family siderophore porin [Candidatus Thiodiazotropha sp. (ex Codakia rugifera)]
MNRHKKAVTMAVITVIAGNSIPFSTTSADEAGLRRELLNLKHKVERLELSRKPLESSEKPPHGWFNYLNLSGLVEVEAAYTTTPDTHASDVALTTVELGIDAQVTPWVNAHGLILFEEGVTDSSEIDEGIITLENRDLSPLSLAVGRMYIPFGNFDSFAVTDPLTLEIGETRETALQAGYISDGFYSSLFLFNGDTKDSDSESIELFGLNLGLASDHETSDFNYEIGLSWINSLADSDNLQESVTDPNNLAKKVPGFSIHAIIHNGPFSLIGEYLTASKSFNATDLVFNKSGAKPAAFNLEAGYAFKLTGREVSFALAWQGTEEALTLDLPETRYLAALAVDIYKYTILGFEYAHDKNYGVSDGGSGDYSDTFTAQLAVVF